MYLTANIVDEKLSITNYREIYLIKNMSFQKKIFYYHYLNWKHVLGLKVVACRSKYIKYIQLMFEKYIHKHGKDSS